MAKEVPKSKRRVKLRDPHVEKERHATWLELFYDLVFVIVVAEIGRNLSEDISALGILKFIILFLPIWQAWVHHTYYSDRFDSDDILHRLLTLIQMFAIASLAASIHGALEETSIEFALSLVAFRVVLIALYRRANHIEEAKPLIKHITKTVMLGGSLWLISIFVPAPWRFLIWILAPVLEIGSSLLPSTKKLFATLPISESHVPERFGLFTIIVLGESVAGVISGLAKQELESISALTAIFGLLITFGIWWIYFDNLIGEDLRNKKFDSSTWVYIHLPLLMSITALGIGVEHTIAVDIGHTLETSVIWLVIGSLTIIFSCLAVIHFSMAFNEAYQRNRSQAFWRVLAGIGTAIIGIIFVLEEGEPLTLLGILALLTLTQVAGDQFVYAKDE